MYTESMHGIYTMHKIYFVAVRLLGRLMEWGLQKGTLKHEYIIIYNYFVYIP